MSAQFRPRILLAEDEANLALGIAHNLEKAGYEVELARDGKTAFDRASSEPFDLILLDVMMPKKDGYEVCQELRQKQILTPILMLTALSEPPNRIQGIIAGADDYLGKPFNVEELLARTAALLRRRSWDGFNKTNTRSRTLVKIGVKIGEIEFIFDELLLKSRTQTAELTLIEAKLLDLLTKNANQLLTRSEILKKVWGFSERVQTRTLDTFIMRLRAHVKTIGGNPDFIESVRGVGYRLVSPR